MAIGMWLYFWDLYSVDPYVCVCVNTMLKHVDYCSFVVLSEVWKVLLPAWFFSLPIPLAILGLLWFPLRSKDFGNDTPDKYSQITEVWECDAVIWNKNHIVAPHLSSQEMRQPLVQGSEVN